jgi:hypothetical protein
MPFSGIWRHVLFKMEAICSSETSIHTITTRRHIPKKRHSYFYRCFIYPFFVLSSPHYFCDLYLPSFLLNFYRALCSVLTRFKTLLSPLLTTDTSLHSLLFVRVISAAFLQLSACLLIDHSVTTRCWTLR